MKFKKYPFVIASTVVMAGAAVALSPTSPAGAVGAVFGLDYYISAPLVQGTHVWGAVKDNFDALTDCTGPLGGGAITVGGTACSMQNVNEYGGASTDGSTPTVGGSGSKFPVAAEAGTRFSLGSPQCYVGLWWSAGSGGNTVNFYSEGTLVLSLESNAIIELLDPSVEPTLESVDGTSYQKDSWFGNPRGHTDTNTDGIPDGTSTINDGEPYVYLNVYGKGGLTFDTVEFAGPNFEFDNLAFSTTCPTPPSSSVFLGYVGEGEPERSNYPIDPDYLSRQILETEELPNTGGGTVVLVWIALALTGGGLALVASRRRLTS